MKKGMKRAYLLTLSVLQLFCAVGFSKIDARCYEEILIEDAAQETSNEAYDAEPLSESPDQDEIIIEDEEYSEEVTTDSEISDAEEIIASEEEVSEEDEEYVGDDCDISILEETEQADSEETVIDESEDLDKIMAAGKATYEGTCGKNLTYIYSVDDKTIRIKGTGAMDSYSRTKRSPWHKDLKKDSAENITEIENIIIEEGVTSIGSFAFINFNSVRKISFPKSLTQIGKNAFSGCRNLMVVGFDGSLPAIKKKAFEDSDVVVFYNSGSKGYSKDAVKKCKKQFRSVSFVKIDKAFDETCGDNLTWSYNDSTKTLKISGSGPMRDYSFVEKTPWGAYAADIKKVEISDKVTYIGDYAFYNVRLDSLNLPASLTGVGKSAFQFAQVTTLTCAENLKNVKAIGAKAFSSAKMKLVSADGVIHLDKATEIGEGAFLSCKMGARGTLKLAEGLKTLPTEVFESCDGVSGTVTFPSSLETIENCAFHYCYYITGTLNITDNIKSVGVNAFCNSGITDVVIGNGLTEIRYGCFGSAYFYTNYLKTIIIGKNVRFIDTFGVHTYYLTKAVFYGDRPRIAARGFDADGSDNLVIYYPAGNSTWDGINSSYFSLNSPDFVLKKMTDEVTVKFNVSYPSGTQSSYKKSYDSQVISKGDTVKMPKLETDYYYIDGKEYNFTGWHTDSKCTKPYDFKLPVQKDMTLYGKYVKASEREEDWGRISIADRQYMKFNTVDQIPKGIWFCKKYESEKLYYTGSQIKPGNGYLSVYHHNQRLTDGKDYEIKYSNNVNIGKARMTIEFMGNYSGKKVLEFEILPINLCTYNRDKYRAYLGLSKMAYTGKVLKPKAYLYMENNMGTFDLTEGKDYEVIYPGTDPQDKAAYDSNAFKEPGKYTVIVRGKGNYSGELYCFVKIVKKISLGKVKCDLPSAIKVENKDTLYKDYGLRYKGQKLLYGIDYTVSSDGEVSDGYLEVVYSAAATSDYTGSLIRKVKLKGKSLKDACVYSPDGDILFVLKNRSDLKKYKAAYKKANGGEVDLSKLPAYINNKVKIGYASYKGDEMYVTISGTGFSSSTYVGKKTCKVEGITALKLKVTFKEKIPFDGLELRPEKVIQVSLNGKDVTGSDLYKMSLEYREGKRYILLDGTDKLLGEKLIEITNDLIQKYDITNNCHIYSSSLDPDPTKRVNICLFMNDIFTAGEAVYHKNTDSMSYHVYFYDDNGKRAYGNMNDFELALKGFDKPGTGTVTVTGKGLYCGTAQLQVKVTPGTSNQLTMYAYDVIYKDQPGNYKTTFTLKEGSVDLKAGVDYDKNKIEYQYCDDISVKRLDPKTGKYKKTKVHKGDNVSDNDLLEVGTRLWVVVPLIGNYAGYESDFYFVGAEDKDLSKATVEYQSYYDFAGKSIELNREDFKVKLNGKYLSAKQYYIEGLYTSMYYPGTYTFVLRGNAQEGYYGKKEIKVTVGVKKVN